MINSGTSLNYGSREHHTAAVLLLLALGLTLAASFVGNPMHQAAANVATACLLWRVWRGANWGRRILVTLSSISACLAITLGLAIALGATGVAHSAITMLVLYSFVGLPLSAPQVRKLRQPNWLTSAGVVNPSTQTPRDTSN